MGHPKEICPSSKMSGIKKNCLDYIAAISPLNKYFHVFSFSLSFFLNLTLFMLVVTAVVVSFLEPYRKSVFMVVVTRSPNS